MVGSHGLHAKFTHDGLFFTATHRLSLGLWGALILMAVTSSSGCSRKSLIDASWNLSFFSPPIASSSSPTAAFYLLA